MSRSSRILSVARSYGACLSELCRIYFIFGLMRRGKEVDWRIGVEWGDWEEKP